MVTHDRVNHRQCVFLCELVEKLIHQRKLRNGTQIAGIDRIKGKPKTFPVCRNGGNIPGQIPEGITLKAAGMRG